MPQRSSQEDKKTEDMDKKKEERRLRESRRQQEDDDAKRRARRSTRSPKGEERKSSNRKSSATSPHRQSKRSERDSKAKHRNRNSRAVVPGAVHESARNSDDDDDSVSLDGDNYVDVKEIHDQRRKGKERRSTRAATPGAVSEGGRRSRSQNRSSSGGSRGSRSGSHERRSSREERRRLKERESRVDAKLRASRQSSKERESKINAKIRASHRGSGTTVNTNNPPPPTGAARRGQNLPPPPGAISSEALGSGVSGGDTGAPTREGEVALAGSLVEENVVATAVEEVEHKPQAAVIASQEHNMETAPPQEEAPQETPFYCTAKFWIVVLIILVGGALGVIFMIQQKNETPPEVGTAPPVETGPVTVQPTTPLPFTEGPSGRPTDSPTNTPIFDPPTPDECEAVARGEDLPGQENLTFRNFQILLDVVLSSDDTIPESVKQEVQSKMQSVIMPVLVGCSAVDSRRIRGRKLQDENLRRLVTSFYVIKNAQVIVSAETVPCTKSDATNCFQITVTIDTYLQGDEKVIALITRVLEALGPENELAAKLGLHPLISQLFIVKIVPGSETDPPSSGPTPVPTPVPTGSPSSNPTTAPVSWPTTKEPTKTPTPAPSKAPSNRPTPGPTAGTPQPTPGPTPPPTPGPTAAPVVGPTPPPTKAPTRNPTPTPSHAPSNVPSGAPSMSPSRVPSSAPSKNPTTAPSNSPSSTPTFTPTKSPSDMPSPSPSTSAPSSNPSVAPFSGKEIYNSHYVLYWPNPDYENSYWYNTHESAEQACNSIGLELCPANAVEGKNMCKAGFFSDTKGYWLDYAWCGGVQGFNWWGWDWAGAYCCGRPVYMPDDRPVSLSSYIYYSREEAANACASKGLQLCSTEQILGYDLCAFGWLKETRGYYMSNGSEFPGCGVNGLNIQDNGGVAGAYCCQGY